jgi:hypothetical protein
MERKRQERDRKEQKRLEEWERKRQERERPRQEREEQERQKWEWKLQQEAVVSEEELEVLPSEAAEKRKRLLASLQIEMAAERRAAIAEDRRKELKERQENAAMWRKWIEERESEPDEVKRVRSERLRQAQYAKGLRRKIDELIGEGQSRARKQRTRASEAQRLRRSPARLPAVGVLIDTNRGGAREEAEDRLQVAQQRRKDQIDAKRMGSCPREDVVAIGRIRRGPEAGPIGDVDQPLVPERLMYGYGQGLAGGWDRSWLDHDWDDRQERCCREVIRSSRGSDSRDPYLLMQVRALEGE